MTELSRPTDILYNNTNALAHGTMGETPRLIPSVQNPIWEGAAHTITRPAFKPNITAAAQLHSEHAVITASV